MAMQFKKARRELARMKIAIGGPSGSGKTMSSLLLAYGLVHAEHPNYSDAECWDKICILDTENGSGSLYVGNVVGGCKIGEYNAIDMAPPFDPKNFVDAIHMAESHDMEVIIIDSLSHCWVGEGGSLDKQGAIAARSGNSYTAWRSVTPEHNKLVDAMLQSKCHVIADIRAKMDYQQTTNDKGKKEIKALGMGLQMRDGIEYEFTVAFMLDYEHIASATKDRTGLFDGRYFVITPDVGKAIYGWLSSGKTETANPPHPVTQAPAAPVQPQIAPEPAVQEPTVEESLPFDMPPAEPEPAMPAISIQELHQAVLNLTNGMTPEQKKAVGETVKSIGGSYNYKSWTDQTAINTLYEYCVKQ